VPDSDPERTGGSKPASGPGAGGPGMGRGLAAILPTSGIGEPGLRHVALGLIRPNPRQPRRSFDEEALHALAESIRSRGLLQPIVVRPLPGGRFELLAGERRLRAAKLAGLDQLPAIVREAEDWERLDLALAENVAREDLNPIEEARACATLVEDLGLTKGEVGRRIGKSRVAVSNLIRLLDLPEPVLDAVEAGGLTEGHGRALLLAKDHTTRKRLADDAQEHGWSVRETERRAREAETGDPSRPRRSATEMHPDLAEALAAAEDTLTAALGREVKVKPTNDGCRAEIEFESPADAVHLAEKLLRNRGGRSLPEAA
jgi:ParB family transcriptional regulator, chromosome partitioning protein